ncbi:hypothetical protein RER_42960 [Rhodococcus erythropolis PR4]|uniref:Uncharacterized protein n=2 Tax=Rhodococcus erythropolis TaxID=1833 RepID=C1A319_RHOE4|nr:hypothetical protein RER_42960 [Rhodococcus erythropolis PR4]
MRSANFWFLSATLQRAIQSGVLKMADSSTRDAAIRRELGVPPTFDLVRHARNLARVFFPALVIALLVGGIVYAVRGSATPVYQSDIVAEVQSASQIVVTDANLGQLVAPYVALATDSDVVAAIHDQLNNGWTTADVSSHISVTPGTSPALVFVKATAFSQADADALARIVVATLSDAQARRNADTLDRRTRVLTDDIARLNGDLDAARRESLDEYETPADDPTIKADLDARLEQLRQLRSTVSGSDRLQLLSAPAGTGLPVAPKPLVESAVAFLVVLILAAEILSACRGRFSSRVTDAWARRTARKYGASLLLQHSEAAEFPPNLALTICQRASLGDHVLVLSGDGVPSTSWDVPAHVRSGVSRYSLKSDWWSRFDSSGTGFALIVVSAQQSNQREIVECLRALAEVDVARTLVLVGPSAPEPLLDVLTLAVLRRRRRPASSVKLAAEPTNSATNSQTPSDSAWVKSGAPRLNEPSVAVPYGMDTSDLVSRRDRASLVDAKTVSIAKKNLPKATPKPSAGVELEEPQVVQTVDVEGAGVEASVVETSGAETTSTDATGVKASGEADGIDSEASTERIMLTSKDIAEIRKRRQRTRVSLIRSDSADGQSES